MPYKDREARNEQQRIYRRSVRRRVELRRPTDTTDPAILLYRAEKAKRAERT